MRASPAARPQGSLAPHASRGRGGWRAYAVAGTIAFLIAGVGGWATEIGPWYRDLKFPSWRPPNWLFPPAWTVIFVLTAVSAGLAWNTTRSPAQRRELIGVFAANAALNIGWSLLFFRFRRPDWALAEVAGLWLSVLLALLAAGRIKPVAGWMLAPYLAWVSFASILNTAIVRLNAPF